MRRVAYRGVALNDCVLQSRLCAERIVAGGGRAQASGASVTDIDAVRELCSARGGIGLLISHDTIVMPVIAWATGERFKGSWLDPLDGIVIAEQGGSLLRVIWRGASFDVRI